MAFTKFWKQNAVIHIAYPPHCEAELANLEIKGNNAKTTPMKLPMGIIGYGVSGFISGTSEESGGWRLVQIRPVQTGSFYPGGPRTAISNGARSFYNSDHGI